MCVCVCVCDPLPSLSRVIEPIAPRYSALLKTEVVTMKIEGAVEEMKPHPKHPKVIVTIT